MALSFFGCDRGLDSLALETVWDPLEGISVLENNTPSRQFAPVREGYVRRRQHADRLARDTCSRADEGGRESASGGREDVGDRRREEERGSEDGRHLAPRGASAEVVFEAVPASGEYERGRGENAGGRWSFDSDDPEAPEEQYPVIVFMIILPVSLNFTPYRWYVLLGQAVAKDCNEPEEDDNPAPSVATPAADVEPTESEGSEWPLNEDDDADDADHGDDEPATNHLVLAQFDKVSMSKNKWKCTLNDE